MIYHREIKETSFSVFMPGRIYIYIFRSTGYQDHQIVRAIQRRILLTSEDVRGMKMIDMCVMIRR